MKPYYFSIGKSEKNIVSARSSVYEIPPIKSMSLFRIISIRFVQSSFTIHSANRYKKPTTAHIHNRLHFSPHLYL